MALNIRWSVIVSLLLLTILARTTGNQLVFSDEESAGHIDFLSDKGIKLLLRWYTLITARMAAINDILDTAESRMTTHFAAESLPNITNLVTARVTDIYTTLFLAQSKAFILGLNNTDDGMRAFFLSPVGIENPNNDYDQSNRDGGTYTVAEGGLYQVTARNEPGLNEIVNIMRNGDEIITSLDTDGFYDVKTRIVLLWLTAGDEIFTTGGSASYLGVNRLRVQTLLSNFMN